MPCQQCDNNHNDHLCEIVNCNVKKSLQASKEVQQALDQQGRQQFARESDKLIALYVSGIIKKPDYEKQMQRIREKLGRK